MRRSIGILYKTSRSRTVESMPFRKIPITIPRIVIERVALTPPIMMRFISIASPTRNFVSNRCGLAAFAFSMASACNWLSSSDARLRGDLNFVYPRNLGRLPWCKKGYESAAEPLFDAVLQSARARGLTTVFAAYRRDWQPVLQFFADHGFALTREMINYCADLADLPTLVSRSSLPVFRLQPSDIPAIAAIGRGIIRLPESKLEKYFFTNPYFPAEAILVLRAANGLPKAIGIGLESSTYADVKKIDPLAPCFRLGAFGTEGLNTKRVNGLFSFLVADPMETMTAGLALLAEASQEMTEGTVNALAAQCPSDAPHLVGFYNRYFKEQGRFPVLERSL